MAISEEGINGLRCMEAAAKMGQDGFVSRLGPQDVLDLISELRRVTGENGALKKELEESKEAFDSMYQGAMTLVANLKLELERVRGLAVKYSAQLACWEPIGPEHLDREKEILGEK